MPFRRMTYFTVHICLMEIMEVLYFVTSVKPLSHIHESEHDLTRFNVFPSIVLERMKVVHSFVFIRVKSWSVARGRMDVAGRLKSCSNFLQCKNLEHDLSRAEKSCSVV